jgi:tRNA(fMet)-specific endonuclease VapC
MYLLDTDHISIIQRQTQPEYGRLSQRVRQHPPAAFYFPVIGFHEQTMGANAHIQTARTNADIVRGYAMYEQILTAFAAAQVRPFDPAAVAVFDALRAQRVRIATMDLRIAATALANGQTLLTRNRRDFQQVPGLNFEDWTV